MIPPFPLRFAQVPRLRYKYGIRDSWYAMFSAPDHAGDSYNIVTSIGAARKQFDDNFAGIWRLLHSGLCEPDLEALMKVAPPRSANWSKIVRLFDVFPFNDYFQTLGLLARDWGRDALVEFSYSSILYNYDKDDEKAVAMVHARRDSVIRVLDKLGRFDIASLCDEPFLDSDNFFSSGNPAPWLETIGDSRNTKEIEKYLYA